MNEATYIENCKKQWQSITKKNYFVAPSLNMISIFALLFMAGKFCVAEKHHLKKKYKHLKKKYKHPALKYFFCFLFFKFFKSCFRTIRNCYNEIIVGREYLKEDPIVVDMTQEVNAQKLKENIDDKTLYIMCHGTLKDTLEKNFSLSRNRITEQNRRCCNKKIFFMKWPGISSKKAQLCAQKSCIDRIKELLLNDEININDHITKFALFGCDSGGEDEININNHITKFALFGCDSGGENVLAIGLELQKKYNKPVDLFLISTPLSSETARKVDQFLKKNKNMSENNTKNTVTIINSMNYAPIDDQMLYKKYKNDDRIKFIMYGVFCLETLKLLLNDRCIVNRCGFYDMACDCNKIYALQTYLTMKKYSKKSLFNGMLFVNPLVCKDSKKKHYPSLLARNIVLNKL